MISLLRTDLMKARKHPTSWIVLSIAAAFVTMVTFSNKSSSLRTFGFPDGLIIGPERLGPLLTLMIAPIGAMLAGMEYRHDTWKNLLTRRPGRSGFVLSKWITLGLLAAGGLLTLSLWSQSLAWFLGGGPTRIGRLNYVGAFVGITLIEMVVVGSMALMGAVARRSALVGMMCATLWYIADEGRLLAKIYSPLKMALFSTAKTSLFIHVLSATDGLPLSTDADVVLLSVPASLLAIAFYLIVPPLLAALLFSRQDISG